MLKPCGTTAAARRHHRKGEELCGPCREAHRENMSELNERRRQLRKEGKTLRQASVEKRAADKVAEQERRDNDPSLMSCCGAPVDGEEVTARYAKRHWTEKTDICEPARLCRNLSDRRRWERNKPAERAEAELEPCGTPAAFQRHKYYGEEPCQPCRDASNEKNNEYKRKHRAKPAPEPEPEPEAAADVERMECCAAPKDGGERTQKYVWRHKQAGTSPCRPAKECRNSMDRKIYKARRCVDDVNERRKERRSA